MSKNETKPTPQIGDAVEVNIETLAEVLSAKVIGVNDDGSIGLRFASAITVNAADIENWSDNGTDEEGDEPYWHLSI